MTEAVMQAAAALADALEAENAALRMMDVPRALAEFPRKSEAALRLRLSLAQLAGRPPSALAPERRAAATAVASRLQALAETNRRLLERAMFVQGRLIATLARAIPPPQTSYGRTASWTARVPPMTLSARA